MQCSDVAIVLSVCLCVLIIRLSLDPDKVHTLQLGDMFLTSLLIFRVPQMYFFPPGVYLLGR